MGRIRLTRGVIVAVLVGSGPLGAQERPGPAATRRPGELVVESDTLTTAEGKGVGYEVGTLYVPENRAKTGSRVIGVGFARFRASTSTPAPPIFLLPGGPGFSIFSVLPRVMREIAQLQQVSDVVIVDQRGFSPRGDILRYPARYPAEPLDQPLSLVRSRATEMEIARAAVADAAAKGIDLAGYTVLECADDVNDLRKALGYDQLILDGTSFGSQWSFAVMRRHPSIVARAILSGVEPLDYGYDQPSTVFAAMARMAKVVERDPAFAPYLPAGGLLAAARTVIDRLEREPIRVRVRDSAADSTVTIVLGTEDFRRWFPQGRRFARNILEAFHGHYDNWAAEVLRYRRGGERPLALIGPLIDGSLGVTAARLAGLRADSATAFLGQWNWDSYVASADIWPSPDVGDSIRIPVRTPIPVVFAQGDWDTFTPIENTVAIAPYFPNGRVLVARHGGHGVIGPIARDAPDVMEKLLGFLRTGSTAEVPVELVLPIPTFEPPTFPRPPGSPQP